MKNPLVEKVEDELKRLGFHDTKLIRESYSAESFGDAYAIYQVGNLYVTFVRDRGNDRVDFISAKPTNQKDTYNFDDISILMGWECLDQMVKEYKYTNIDFSKPYPWPDPIPLSEELGWIKKDIDKLQVMFSPSELDNTLEQLKETCRKRCKALFDWEPPQ